jgi:lysophospholipase L1-like esterase
MQLTRTLLVLSLATAFIAGAQEAKKAAPAPGKGKAQAKKAVAPRPAPPVKGLGLNDGDRFIFIGDSITHQCLYTQYVEDYFFTRYPDKKISFRNAGVSGDRAQDALDRFDDDIASFKPTIATVLLGMNDASYKDFDAAVFKTYADGMTQLCDKLDAIHCKVILMSPTMFDHQAFEAMVAKDPAKSKNKQPDNYNAVLAYYGKWVQETARKRGYRFVDLYGPLNVLTTAERAKDKDFTLIPDAIHPAADGQLVMAYELLHQVGEFGPVLGGGVRVVNNQWTALSPIVSGISGEPRKSVSYTIAQKSLPWVVTTDAAHGWQMENAGHHSTAEQHIVVGLDAGRYELILNGQTVGVFDEKMFGVHAEIENDEHSPTHQQALKIADLNKQRNAEAINPMRGLYSQRKGKLRAAKQANDMTEFNKWVETELKPKEAELIKKADEIEAEIRQLAKLQPIKVEVKPAAPAAPKPAAAKTKKAA